MSEIPATYSVSGVRIADDFRDNLIIDKYAACFVEMRESKKRHLRSENSEDVLSWNVFRSLRQINPTKWLNDLASRTFGITFPGDPTETSIELWKNIPPPQALLKSGDEGISEIDIVLENPEWVWFIEAKFRSDISTGTTTRPSRDQVLRNIDVGSHYAGVRKFYFSLLHLNEKYSPKGIEALKKYSDLELLRAALPHRSDLLSNIAGVGCLRWVDISDVLRVAKLSRDRADENIFAERALAWMEEKGIADAQQ